MPVMPVMTNVAVSVINSVTNEKKNDKKTPKKQEQPKLVLNKEGEEAVASFTGENTTGKKSKLSNDQEATKHYFMQLQGGKYTRDKLNGDYILTHRPQASGSRAKVKAWDNKEAEQRFNTGQLNTSAKKLDQASIDRAFDKTRQNNPALYNDLSNRKQAMRTRLSQAAVMRYFNKPASEVTSEDLKKVKTEQGPGVAKALKKRVEAAKERVVSYSSGSYQNKKMTRSYYPSGGVKRETVEESSGKWSNRTIWPVSHSSSDKASSAPQEKAPVEIRDPKKRLEINGNMGPYKGPGAYGRNAAYNEENTSPESRASRNIRYTPQSTIGEDGKLNEAGMNNLLGYSKGELAEADTNKNGIVSLTELRQAFHGDKAKADQYYQAMNQDKSDGIGLADRAAYNLAADQGRGMKLDGLIQPSEYRFIDSLIESPEKRDIVGGYFAQIQENQDLKKKADAFKNPPQSLSAYEASGMRGFVQWFTSFFNF